MKDIIYSEKIDLENDIEQLKEWRLLLLDNIEIIENHIVELKKFKEELEDYQNKIYNITKYSAFQKFLIKKIERKLQSINPLIFESYLSMKIKFLGRNIENITSSHCLKKRELIKKANFWYNKCTTLATEEQLESFKIEIKKLKELEN